MTIPLGKAALPSCWARVLTRSFRNELPKSRQTTFTPSIRSQIASRSFTKASTRTIPSSEASHDAASLRSSRYALVKQLITKPTPTLLYEAPSHFWFYFGCWSTGISMIGWVAVTGGTATKQPDGVPNWVNYAMGASYLTFAGIGIFTISRTSGIVRAIRMLPSQQTVAIKGAAPAVRNPQLEVTVRRMLPFLQPKVLVTNLDNVVMATRFSLPPDLVPELRRKATEDAKKKAQHKFDMQHLLTMPFRRLGRGFVGFFRGVRAAWTDLGFGAIKIDGKQYKVDVTRGFAHDGFVTLERLVTVGST